MNKTAVCELLTVARELSAAGFPSKYFSRSGVKERADQYGLMDVENEDLTDEGLLAKLAEWQESEHGVDAFVYDDAAKILRKHGKKIPGGISRMANNKSDVMRELTAVEKLMAMEFPTQDALDKYLKEHPDPDRDKHRVKETKKGPVKKEKAPLPEREDVENAFRDHLSQSDRTVTKESMKSVMKGQFKGMTDVGFDNVWNNLVEEKYLVPAKGGYKWEM